MLRFFDTVNERPAALGLAYVRDIRQVRTAAWAAVAQAEDEARRIELRQQYLNTLPRPEKYPHICDGWSAISELRQKPHLEGVRHPQNRTIENVARYAPVSRKVFYSVLWEVLSPNTSYATCMNTVMMFDEDNLETVISSLLTGRALGVVEQLAELGTTAALAAQIRLLRHKKKYDQAFDAGRALAQALCYHAVNPFFATIASRLWSLVSTGVLQGLRNGQFQFTHYGEGYSLFSGVLLNRLASAEALYGVHRLASGPRFSWSTIVDMNSECIRGFATPGFERPDELQSFLDVGFTGRSRQSVTNEDLLFRYVGRPEEKCNPESVRPKRRNYSHFCLQAKKTAGES
ncbi:hypothetical protein [Dyella sp. 20L07]|uniref:hypothetical protein n=1 Tax=Dyella sp. 20L07 TaxID=3384240 RepID=UPI003D26EA0F